MLLFAGEEVQGAQQDRIFDVTILVAAGSRLQVPVSCVEAGRWDGERHGEAFLPSSQTAYPSLRAAKNRQVSDALHAGLEARADQQGVWNEVQAMADRHDSVSDTGAMDHIYGSRADSVAELEAGLSRRDGQLGALVFIGERPVVLDYVSRPEGFAALWRPLVRGYCLDGLEEEAVATAPDPARFLDALGAARTTRRAGTGLGEAVSFGDRILAGAGLAVDGELVQLSAFAADAEPTRSGRIVRPSRRR